MGNWRSLHIKELDESNREFLKVSLAQQEATLKAVISAHAQKQESQLEELKKLILNLTSTTPPHLQPPSGAALLGDVVGSATDDDELREPISEECNFVKENVKSVRLTTPPAWKYDIFISFRGDDTRRGFASHLFCALRNADINCYRDVDRDGRGQEVGPMLIDAIHHSMMAIVLFSKNYADSKWCLQELVEILIFNEQYHAYGHTVLPIFYDVEPTQVRNLSGKVGEAFKRCRVKNKQQRKAWRDALEVAGNLSSWHLVNDANGNEAEFIEQIVEELQNRVFYTRSAYFVKSPVGMKDNVDRLICLMDIRSMDIVRKMGIYGPEGIGKTALAKVICSRLYNEFEGQVTLLENIHDANKEGLLRLQNTLVRDVLKIKQPFMSDDRANNIGEIRKRLDQKKVLLVLDNLDNPQELMSILGEELERFLGPGSRILITTRNKQLLDNLKVDEMDIVLPLSPKDSLQFFYQQAFIEGNPTADSNDEDLSKNLVHYAGGFPLVLQTLGSFLFDKPKDEWHQILGKLVRSCRLDSIGIYSKSVSPLYTYQKFGPFGGTGKPFDHGRRFTTVRKITVTVGETVTVGRKLVHSVFVEYDYNGSYISSHSHGWGLRQPKKCNTYKVTLNYPDEYLTSISGHTVGTYRFGAIKSIKFHSKYKNKSRDYGPYGEEEGTSFSSPEVDDGKIIGLFGDSDPDSLQLRFLDSIGVYLGPVSDPSPFTTSGPFGGCNDDSWDDGKHLDIRKIEVSVSDSGIESIRITYDNYGHPLGPSTHGEENVACVPHLVKIDYPYEYLTAISGYTGKTKNSGGEVDVVRCLIFHSNRRSYGPYGDDKVGQRFCTPSCGRKIVGFFGGGGGGSQLQSIGVHLEAVSHVHPHRYVGPFGGDNGAVWDHGDNRDDIRVMVIEWGSNGVISVSCGDDKKGLTDFVESDSSKLIELDYAREYIKAMEGFYEESKGDVVIKQLKFETNLKTYGPYGDENIKYATYFRTPWNVGKIIGFYGRKSRDRLSSIGAYFGPVYHVYPLETIGPFGYYYSKTQWDDGRHSGIRQINLRFGSVIDGIRFVYDDTEESKTGDEYFHGGVRAAKEDIKLDYPKEYLVAMSGYTGTLRDHMCVKSLRFETNYRKIGPYGIEEGQHFSFGSNIGKIVGFYGSNDVYLESIGAHISLLSCD